MFLATVVLRPGMWIGGAFGGGVDSPIDECRLPGIFEPLPFVSEEMISFEVPGIGAIDLFALYPR